MQGFAAVCLRRSIGVGALLLAHGCAPALHAEPVFPTAPLAVLGAAGERIEFQVEVADDDRLRSRGLMFRKELPPERGMLLLFERPGRAAIWMKNTPIPLDILFIDESGTIVHIHEHAVPYSLATIASPERVRAVLEINGGQAAQLGIRIGDRIEYAPLWSGS
jgi:uncharacterized membrane protein (UPF0127 family)